MSFRDLDLPLSLSTTELDPLKTFFEPVLGNARTYDVGVGYFSSLWVRDAAAGVARFACNGGHARWVVSPDLSEEDLRAIAGAADPEEQAKPSTSSCADRLTSCCGNSRRILGQPFRGLSATE